MPNTVWAVVRDGKVELLEPLNLPEGTKVLVTLLPDDEREFWAHASQTALDSVWNNTEDDMYAQLLKE
jgi:predicted DNA-binding antitoxin AbrB/MazE fold protein